MSYEQAISFLLYPPDLFWLKILKYLFIGFSAAAVVFILVFALFLTNWFTISFGYDIYSFFTFRSMGEKKIVRQWKKILRRLETGLESEYKLAVIEADSFFDDVLKNMGYEGESLGERLDKIPATLLPNLEALRQAHQVRNNVVHDPDYKLELEEAKKAISVYEKFLVDLGVF